MKKDMTIAEYGPSKQFLTDALKQLTSFSVPVLAKWVKIFEIVERVVEGEIGAALELFPVQEDILMESNVPDIDTEISNSMQCAKVYAHVVGRMMVRVCLPTQQGRDLYSQSLFCIKYVLQLHSFINRYQVLRGTMTPFFITCKNVLFVSFAMQVQLTKFYVFPSTALWHQP